MRFFAFLALCFMLAACSWFGAKAPSSQNQSAALGARICANQCSFAADYCRQACNAKQSRCIADVRGQALHDYDKYTREQYASHQESDLNVSDFERMAPCNTSYDACYSDCESKSGMCYANCSGKTSKHENTEKPAKADKTESTDTPEQPQTKPPCTSSLCF